MGDSSYGLHVDMNILTAKGELSQREFLYAGSYMSPVFPSIEFPGLLQPLAKFVSPSETTEAKLFTNPASAFVAALAYRQRIARTAERSLRSGEKLANLTVAVRQVMPRGAG